MLSGCDHDTAFVRLIEEHLTTVGVPAKDGRVMSIDQSEDQSAAGLPASKSNARLACET